MNKLSPAVVCGFGAAVASFLPGFKNFSCCLIIPAAAFLSLYLYKRITRDERQLRPMMSANYGLTVGMVSAVFLTAFEVISAALTKTNDFVKDLPQLKELIKQTGFGPETATALSMLDKIAYDIQSGGFSITFLIVLLCSNLLINSIFGTVGGLIGMAYLNREQRL